MLPLPISDYPEPPPPPALVARVGNEIYFHCEVNQETCLQLIKLLHEIEAAPQLDATFDNITPITLHIQSPGGGLMSAFAVIDILENLKTPTISIVEGYAASAASLLSMACDTRRITKRSVMLIHQFNTFFWGSYEQWKDDDVLNQILITNMRNFYKSRSKLNKKQVIKMLQHDSWFNSTDALVNGFVDEII